MRSRGKAMKNILGYTSQLLKTDMKEIYLVG